MKQVNHSAGGSRSGEPTSKKLCLLESSQLFDIFFLALEKDKPQGLWQWKQMGVANVNYD